jgi:Tfp pilus assembly protein PilX
VNTSDTQIKLSANLQWENEALNNAEAAVTTAERWLASDNNHVAAAFTAGGTEPAAGTPHILPMTLDASVRAARLTRPLSMTWDNSNSLQVGGNNAAGNPMQRYYIELMSQNNKLQGSSQVVGSRSSTACSQVNTYQITGRGEGARGATKIVQTFYSVLSC